MDITIPIQCPKCGHTIKKRLAELQRKQDMTCRCGAVLTIDPAGFKSVGKSIDQLDKAITKLGK